MLRSPSLNAKDAAIMSLMLTVRVAASCLRDAGDIEGAVAAEETCAAVAAMLDRNGASLDPATTADFMQEVVLPVMSQ